MGAVLVAVTVLVSDGWALLFLNLKGVLWR